MKKSSWPILAVLIILSFCLSDIEMPNHYGNIINAASILSSFIVFTLAFKIPILKSIERSKRIFYILINPVINTLVFHGLAIIARQIVKYYNIDQTIVFDFFYLIPIVPIFLMSIIQIIFAKIFLKQKICLSILFSILSIIFSNFFPLIWFVFACTFSF